MKDSAVESRNKSPHPLPIDQTKVHAESGPDGATFEQTGFADPRQQMEGFTGGGDMQAQAATLRRLTGAQQQQMFKRIGQLQGNHHAQQLVPTLIPGTKSEPAETASLYQETPIPPYQTTNGEAGAEDQPAPEQHAETQAQAPVEENKAPRTAQVRKTEATAPAPAAESKTEETAQAQQAEGPAQAQAKGIEEKKAAQASAEEKQAGETAPEPQIETSAQASTGEPQNKEQAGLFPAAPPVDDQVSATLDLMAATPPTQISKVLAQAQPPMMGQQQMEQAHFAAQWKHRPDVASLLMNPPAVETAETAPATGETASEETDETEFEHIQATKEGPNPEKVKKSTSAGARPKVALAGKANPTLVQENREANQTTLAEQRAQMDATANADFGETSVVPTEFPEAQAETTLAPQPANQQNRLPSATLNTDAIPPVEQLSGGIGEMVDQVFAPKVNARFQEVQTQQQQYHAAYQQEMQSLQMQGEQEIATIAQETRQEQTNIEEQSATQVGQIKQEWQAENQRVEAEHNAQAATMEAQVDQQIQDIVTAHEQQSDQTLTTAENDAESTRSQAEAEADQIRSEAKREAAAQEAARQNDPDGAQTAAKRDPMAQAEALIADLFEKMRQEVMTIMTTGHNTAGQQVAEGVDLVGEAIAELRAQFMEQLNAALAEYPLLMLWAEMKINEALDQATEAFNTLASNAGVTAGNAYLYIQYGMQKMIEQYQGNCLNLMNQAAKIKEGGLDATETELMVEELSKAMNDRLKAGDTDFVADQTERVQNLLGGYGVTLTGDAGLTWGYAESLVMLTAVDQLDHKLTEAYREQVQQDAYNAYMANMRERGCSYEQFIASQSGYIDQLVADTSGRTMFERVYGNDLTLNRVGAADDAWANAGNYPTNHSVVFYSNAFSSPRGYGGGNFEAVQNAIHELGHVYEWRVGHPTDSTRVPRGTLGDDKTQAAQHPDQYYWPGRNEGFAGPYLGWQQNPTANMDGEEFADMYIGWAYDQWAEDPETGGWTQAGQARADWMENNMDNWTSQAVNRDNETPDDDTD